jgi:hypothetical protein
MILDTLFSQQLIRMLVMVVWGSMALVQCAATNFAGLLVIRLILGYVEWMRKVTTH